MTKSVNAEVSLPFLDYLDCMADSIKAVGDSVPDNYPFKDELMKSLSSPIIRMVTRVTWITTIEALEVDVKPLYAVSGDMVLETRPFEVNISFTPELKFEVKASASGSNEIFSDKRVTDAIRNLKSKPNPVTKEFTIAMVNLAANVTVVVDEVAAKIQIEE